MRKMFQIVGVIALLVGSFMYTEEVALTSKASDDLLLEIENKKENYKVTPVEAIVTKTTIIPGKNGQEVNVKESYNKIRQIGYFNDKLLEYNPTRPKNQLKDNKDKFIISANKTKKEIALIFKVKENSNINKIIGTLDQTKATFYITSKYLEQNHNQTINLIKKGHTIGNLSNNEDYNDSNFAWMKTIITNTGKQKNNYCYTNNQDKEILKICNLQNSYTIIPTTIITSRPLINIKQNLKKGAIISIETNEELNDEIENIINYIKSKGYKLKSLENILKE